MWNPEGRNPLHGSRLAVHDSVPHAQSITTRGEKINFNPIENFRGPCIAVRYHYSGKFSVKLEHMVNSKTSVDGYADWS